MRWMPCLLLVSALSLAPVLGGHPFSIHDMLAMQRISDPQVSPDGQSVAYTLRTTDLEANRGRTDIYMMLAQAGEAGPYRLTTHEAADYSPRWAADGRSLYFMSTRSGSSQVWRLPLSLGEAVQVTDLPLDVTSFAVSPDGTQLVVSMDVFTDCNTIQCTVDRLKAVEEAPTTGLLYDKLFVRHWDHWKDGRRSHIFAHPLAKGAEPIDLMRGMDADCPSKPFGGPEEYTVAPDGKSVVFSARIAGTTEPWSTNFDLYQVPMAGGTPQNLTEANKAWDTQPVFSPKGDWLAYLAMKRAGYESDRLYINLMNLRSGERKILAESWDRSAGSIVWSPDQKMIFTTANDLGQRSLFAIGVRDGGVKKLIGEGTVRSPAVARDRIVFGMDHLKGPVELYSTKFDGSGTRRISRVNDARVREAQMGDAEQFTFKGWNNETVHAYVVKPANYQAGKKYPVAFLIHGGPQGSFGNDFHYRWNPQAYAGAGYAAVMVDFHGSVGYGQGFTDSIAGDWGGKPLEDLQKGLAAALNKYDFLDGEKVCALGASYGGYMINWIAGNWNDRFKCLVNHDGNLDELTAYYMTEELWFPEWERSGTPWDKPEAYTKHSPIHHVGKWQTPMLVIHGALDYRVVDTQGLATFTALQRRGIPSKLLYFPDENHWVLKPANSVQWHETVIGWLDQWLKD